MYFKNESHKLENLQDRFRQRFITLHLLIVSSDKKIIFRYVKKD